MNTNSKAKRILCYGDSNTWGWIPSSAGLERFSVDERWTGILQNLLGNDYEIIEEGLGGRTTAFEDPRSDFPERNGARTLPVILESHLPLNLVILMLGTTDTKEMLNLSTEDTTEGMRKLIRTAKNCKVLKGSLAPKILVVVPPIIKEGTELTLKLFKGGSAKGYGLIEAYGKLAEDEKVFYLNPSQEIEVDEKEGIHLDVENHKKLAKIIYKAIIKCIT